MPDIQSLAKINFETEDEIIVFAVINSSADEIEYSEEWLDVQLTEYGCSGLNVLDTAHEKITELLANNKSGRVMLGYIIDAKVEIKLSDDLLAASLYITAPEGGDAPGSKEIVEALNSQNVSLNLVDKKHIVDLVQKSRIVEPGESVSVIVANGRAPQHGKDTQFECLIDNVTDRRPNVRDDGSLDYFDLGEIPCIEAGCNLMRKVAPVPAKNGRSVTGEDLKADIGKKLKFDKFPGAEVSPIDPDMLVSTIKGQPVITSKGIHVENVYVVKSVDVHTGHIDFDGSLVVKGDVASGMKINVTGDVQIFGMVENAAIEAGGNIDIKLSAIGRADNLGSEEKTEINCKGNLSAAQLENVCANVQGDILIKSRISNSKVKAGHQIIVGNSQQDKSGIVGGYTAAGSVVRAEVLGSSAGTLTSVSITSSDEVLERFETIKKEISEQEEHLGKMLSLAVGLSKKQSEKAKELLIKVKKDTKELKEKVNNLISEKSEVKALIEHSSAGRIIVQKEAHPGVIVKIMQKEQQIKSRYSKGEFLLFDGNMSFNSLVS
jgi:uncharacterized protein (DUF342 family)